MKIFITVATLILVIWLLRASQMPLQALDEILPYDRGSSRKATEVAYGSDPRQRLDVYAPTASGPFPVIVFIHGGSWSSGDKKDYGFLGRALASQGYVVFVPNYRLVPQHRYPTFVQDTAAAIAFVQKSADQYGGDQSAIYVMGHSAGAYNLAQAMLNPEFFSAAGVDRSTIRAAALLAGPFDFLPLDVPSTVDAFGQWPDLAATQPINYSAENAPPTLILHGAADKTVFPKNSRALAKLLGAKSTLKEYPGIGHVGILLSIAMPLRWRCAVLDDAIAFFRAHPK